MDEFDLKNSLLNIYQPKPESFKKGFKESFKVRVFDPTKHKKVGENKTHEMYNCPYCFSVRLKHDNDGKFYFDKEKKIGRCFKCLTVGVLTTDKDISELDLDKAIYSLDSKYKESEEIDHIFSSIQYEKMYDPIDQEAIDYLDNRCPLYSSFADKLRFRISPTIGVTVPIQYWGKDISYNLRFYKPNGKMKYYIPNGVKYVYSPNNVFCEKGRYQEITLVEGYFDAIGALLDGYKNPIALFGLSITPLQIEMIRSISPVKIKIYLDEAKLSWNLYWKIKDKFPTVQKIEVVPTNYDPEERFMFNLKRCKAEDLPKFLEKVEKIYNDEFYTNND